jgi:hypothetical protein
VFKERTVRENALDNFVGATDFVVAWVCERSWRQLDTHTVAGSAGSFDLAVDHRPPRGGLDLWLYRRSE